MGKKNTVADKGQQPDHHQKIQHSPQKQKQEATACLSGESSHVSSHASSHVSSHTSSHASSLPRRVGQTGNRPWTPTSTTESTSPNGDSHAAYAPFSTDSEGGKEESPLAGSLGGLAGHRDDSGLHNQGNLLGAAIIHPLVGQMRSSRESNSSSSNSSSNRQRPISPGSTAGQDQLRGMLRQPLTEDMTPHKLLKKFSQLSKIPKSPASPEDDLSKPRPVRNLYTRFVSVSPEKVAKTAEQHSYIQEPSFENHSISTIRARSHSNSSVEDEFSSNKENVLSFMEAGSEDIIEHLESNQNADLEDEHVDIDAREQDNEADTTNDIISINEIEETKDTVEEDSYYPVDDTIKDYSSNEICQSLEDSVNFNTELLANEDPPELLDQDEVWDEPSSESEPNSSIKSAPLAPCEEDLQLNDGKPMDTPLTFSKPLISSVEQDQVLTTDKTNTIDPRSDLDWGRILCLVDALCTSASLDVDHGTLSSSDRLYISLRKILLEVKCSIRGRTQEENLFHSDLLARLSSVKHDISHAESDKEKASTQLESLKFQIKLEQSRIVQVEQDIDSLKHVEKELRADIVTHETICAETAIVEASLKKGLDEAIAIRVKSVTPMTVFERLGDEISAIRSQFSVLFLGFVALFCMEALLVYLYARTKHYPGSVDAAFNDPTRNIEGGLGLSGLPGVWIVPTLDHFFRLIFSFFEMILGDTEGEAIF
ncbi:hypothetical protein BASA50_006918 [Batrachochytrium salamandrivorans]|uniref:Uncharacterized protein n=1 Tax=Batrachochytrium salamandrivorans TaxID=1357716 RepID=A0ABQ8F8F7_9FUNG|nr:hypothetical protein BASA62_002016 [Batrachochytrium salamandrivorans]KAH6594011.1 hypothetical protein BASA50_006918 [Batrachochytrium salamandrivorans]